MLQAHIRAGSALAGLPPDADLSGAVWIDLCAPEPEEAAGLEALGYSVPSLADMQEIEVSNRLYRDGTRSVMTVMLPGQTQHGVSISGPVTFIVDADRLVTVRHHRPRPFETFAARAGRSGAGSGDGAHVFLGLIEEIVGRLADLLEEAGASLEASIKPGQQMQTTAALTEALELVGRQGDLLGRVRLAILTLDRALTFFGLDAEGGRSARVPKTLVRALQRDLQSLEVHADYLETRLTLITDLTLGMVNLAQGQAAKSLSVVAAAFLPPTLIASVFGMNFGAMPLLDHPHGFAAAMALMAASVLLTYLIFRWFKWL